MPPDQQPIHDRLAEIDERLRAIQDVLAAEPPGSHEAVPEPVLPPRVEVVDVRVEPRP